jgi:hypothetical protein
MGLTKRDQHAVGGSNESPEEKDHDEGPESAIIGGDARLAGRLFHDAVTLFIRFSRMKIVRNAVVKNNFIEPGMAMGKLH